jgi:hypothetical protein
MENKKEGGITGRQSDFDAAPAVAAKGAAMAGLRGTGVYGIGTWSLLRYLCVLCDTGRIECVKAPSFRGIFGGFLLRNLKA